MTLRVSTQPRTTPPIWTPPLFGRPLHGFPRGARPSPRHVLSGAVPYVPIGTSPSQFAVVPAQLSMWGNDTYGDCVTAEEAFAKACFLPEVFLPDALVVAWATQYGYRDGADLPDVMTTMLTRGMVSGTQMYCDGPATAVDYSTEAVLQSAIFQGTVKLGIDADALPAGAGNQQGWYDTGGSPQQYSSEDHCVSTSGYGPAAWLCQQLGVPLPAALTPTQGMYLLFTWSTIGLVDHAWLMSTVGEAWLRTPTTVGVPPLDSVAIG